MAKFCGATSTDSQPWSQVIDSELQIIIVTKLSKNSPGGLVPTPLDE